MIEGQMRVRTIDGGEDVPKALIVTLRLFLFESV